MEKSESKLNKQLSKYYVEHACQISSPGTVARELDLIPERVSDLRGGRRQLTVAQAEIIKEIYGLPSASEGHWMECELLSSKDLHKQFIDNGLAIHFIQLIEMANSDKFIDEMVKNIYINETEIPGYQRAIGLPSDIRPHIEHQNARLVKEYKLKLFNTLLSNEKFAQWCSVAIRIMTSHTGTKDSVFYENILYGKDVLSAISEGGVTHWDTPTSDYTTLPDIFKSVSDDFSFNALNFQHPVQIIEILYFFNRLSSLVTSATYSNLIAGTAELSFGKQIRIDKKTLPIKEYVIVGKPVWDVDINRPLKLLKPIVSESVIGWRSYEKFPQLFSAISPPMLTHATFRLFYTEQYKYLLEVCFLSDEYAVRPDRVLLIEIENRQAIFDELMAIFDYFQVEHEFAMKNIKRAVAFNGGYIPSAIYLD